MLINKKKLKNNYKNKKAFSFSEIIVATFISAIIVSFIFVFLGNIMEGIGETKREANILSSFYDFTNKINNYRNIYITGGILVDNINGSDIFLMEDSLGENGILLGPVKLSNSKLDTDNTVYEDKGIGFRKISSTEIADIDADINVIYNYVFQKDQIFSELKVQDFILISYNNGKIYDLSLILNTDFQISLISQIWNSLPKDSLKKFNINF